MSENPIPTQPQPPQQVEAPLPTHVRLQCVKEGSKLRVRIISHGYNHDANCQFPRDIRAPGRQYSVPISDVSFTEGPRRKFFYRVKKNNIKICSDAENIAVNGDRIVPSTPDVVHIEKIFGDDEDTECSICLCAEKDVVFAPCGHFSCCGDCAKQVKACPMCRSKIDRIVRRDEIE